MKKIKNSRPLKGSVNEIVMSLGGPLIFFYTAQNRRASAVINMTFSLTDPFTALPVIWVAARMGYGGDQDHLAAKNEGDVVREPRHVNSSVAAATLPPEQRMLHDSRTGALNDLAKPHA
jgi:hypothetical protein